MRLVVSAALLASVGIGAACAAFGAEDADDASVPDAASPDVAPGPDARALTDAGSRCAVGSAFGAPVALNGLAAYSVEALRFGFNRAVVFSSLCPLDGEKFACELYQGIVVGADTFGGLSPLGTVNEAGYDSYPTVTGAAEYLLFGSSRAGSVRIYVAAAQDGIFAGPKVLDLKMPNTGSNEPYLLADGKTFWFAAGVGGGAWSLYRATGDVPVFGTPARADALTSGAGENAPVPTEDELEIFFSSARDTSASNLEIWTSSRASTAQPFAAPTRLGGDFASPGNDWPTWLSPDACELYFIKKAGVIAEPYVARRTRP